MANRILRQVSQEGPTIGKRVPQTGQVPNPGVSKPHIRQVLTPCDSSFIREQQPAPHSGPVRVN